MHQTRDLFIKIIVFESKLSFLHQDPDLLHRNHDFTQNRAQPFASQPSHAQGCLQYLRCTGKMVLTSVRHCGMDR